jgi:hypothetical protein
MVHLQQILLQMWEKGYKNFQNVESNFSRAENVKNTSFWVVLEVQKQWDFCWRFWMLKTIWGFIMTGMSTSKGKFAY